MGMLIGGVYQMYIRAFLETAYHFCVDPIIILLNNLGVFAAIKLMSRRFDFTKHEKLVRDVPDPVPCAPMFRGKSHLPLFTSAAQSSLLPNKLPLAACVMTGGCMFTIYVLISDKSFTWTTREEHGWIAAVIQPGTTMHPVEGKQSSIGYVNSASYSPFDYCETNDINSTCVPLSDLCDQFANCIDESAVATFEQRCLGIKNGPCGFGGQAASIFVWFTIILDGVTLLLATTVASEFLWRLFLRKGAPDHKLNVAQERKRIKFNKQHRITHLRILMAAARKASTVAAAMPGGAALFWYIANGFLVEVDCGGSPFDIKNNPGAPGSESCNVLDPATSILWAVCGFHVATAFLLVAQPMKFERTLPSMWCVMNDSDSDEDASSDDSDDERRKEKAKSKKKGGGGRKTGKAARDHEANAAGKLQCRLRGFQARKLAAKVPGALLPNSSALQATILESYQHLPEKVCFPCIRSQSTHAFLALPNQVRCVASYLGLMILPVDHDDNLAIWRWPKITLIDPNPSAGSKGEMDIELKDKTFATLKFDDLASAMSFHGSCKRFMDIQTGKEPEHEEVELEDVDVFEVELSKDPTRCLPSDVDVGVSEDGVCILAPGTNGCLRRWEWSSVLNYQSSPVTAIVSETRPLVGGEEQVIDLNTTNGQFSFILPRDDAYDMIMCCKDSEKRLHRRLQAAKEKERLLKIAAKDRRDKLARMGKAEWEDESEGEEEGEEGDGDANDARVQI
jgi:hypothetical protein